MSVFKLVPRIDESSAAIDIQFTNNVFGAWTNLITDDLVSTYPKRFSDSRVTEDTFLRFRIKLVDDTYTDYSDPAKPKNTGRPELSSSLCYIYGRVYDVNSQETLNTAKIRFRATGGTAIGFPDIREKYEETDNYGWFMVALTPGKTYDVTCAEASLKKTITVPSTHNALLSSL